MIGFVGTQADRLGDDTAPATTLSPYCAFFQVAATPSYPHVIQQPIDSAQLYITTPTDSFAPTGWESIGVFINASQVLRALIPAGTLQDALYTFSRGNVADLGSAPKLPGLPYFARDNGGFYVYNDVSGEWVHINAGAPAIGSMIGYQQQLPITVGSSWIRADGTVQTIAQYPLLYEVIGKTFEDPSNPTDATHFRLPKQSNTLIRASV
jgi:hypothetical protein